MIASTEGSNNSSRTLDEIEVSSIQKEQDLEASQQQKDTDISQDPNIDGGYAWVICFACLLLNFNTWGVIVGLLFTFLHTCPKILLQGLQNRLCLYWWYCLWSWYCILTSYQCFTW